MECNKEEAIRAKDIAEKKMQAKDFVGARKIALKAQQLYSDLDNISQMLTVCDVHCSAEHRVLGTEMNWYTILQVEATADEGSIKKQYRKLALLLHPDKNKFAGAEAAFKLIGEAHRVLSDQTKRSVYDMKYRAAMNAPVPKQPQKPQNRNSNVMKQPVMNYTTVNIGVKVNQQRPQPTQPVFSNDKQTFWTACPWCNMRFQYYRDILDRALRCQNCKKPFVAYNLNVQGASGASGGQSSVPLQKEVPSQKVFPSTVPHQGHSGLGTTASDPSQKTFTSEVGKGSKKKAEEERKVNKQERKAGNGKPKFNAEKPTTSKRGRKSEEDPIESCDTESSTDSDEYEKVYMGGGLESTPKLSGDYCRRSSRQKQQVNYNENASNNDILRPPKRSKGTKSSDGGEAQSEESMKAATSECKLHDGSSAVSNKDKEMKNRKGCDPREEYLPNGIAKDDECRENKKDSEAMEDDMETTEVDGNVESNASDKTKPDPEFFEVPDPDFYDFDKDRKEDSFAVDQMWAIYDDVDGMPRFYARIKKVFSPGFRVQITWLEADPDDDDEVEWFNEGLPVACGIFKHGKSETTKDIGMFSHVVPWEKGKGRATYKIYPRKGDIWALFKNWDMKWRSDPDNHRNYDFEFVEVLSDYAEGSAITVAFLTKVKGFVSLFRLKDEVMPAHIPANELLRFSHRIPSYRTMGTERDNVPKGYLELDPACLPDNLEEFGDPEEVKLKTESKDCKINSSSKIPSMGCSMPEMSINPDEKSLRDGGTSGSRKHSLTNESMGCKNGKNLNPVKDGVSKDSVHSEPSSPGPEEIPNPKFHHFDSDRTPGKIQGGQIWALYCDLDGLPKFYAQVTKVQSTPDFTIEVRWIEPSLPLDLIEWSEKDIPICCGRFELGESQVFTDTTTFSHQADAIKTAANKFEIYPRKGEVWAMYKNFNPEWQRADVVNCEYEMVEVLSANGLMTKVLPLEVVDGFKMVFKARRIEASPIALEIPKTNLFKFSHKVPAFRITKEGNGVRKGYWELDPKSLPASLFRPC